MERIIYAHNLVRFVNRMKIETENNQLFYYNMPDLENCNLRPLGISLVSYLIKKSLIIFYPSFSEILD